MTREGLFMVSLDRTTFVPYPLPVMLNLSRQRLWPGPITLAAVLLSVVLPLCLVAGTMVGQDSCQDLGSPPGLCGKVVTHGDALAAVLAPLIALGSTNEGSGFLTIYLGAALPSAGLLATADGRAPPLAHL